MGGMDLNDVETVEFRALGGADNVVVGAALADGSPGGAGATLGVGVLVSGTEASIGGTATVDAASVTVATRWPSCVATRFTTARV